ncbi:MAG TPA: copper-binding protein [Thermoanaerobaculia bacterium]|nr:copper-binding protein [Thermoanaerobaculia bacterium]
MRLSIAFALLVAVSGCGKSEPPAKETTYALTATIVSRDASRNVVTLDNKEIPGVMEAMRMDYRVRDAKVSALPPDGTPVNATLHEREGSYWVTAVKPVK